MCLRSRLDQNLSLCNVANVPFLFGTLVRHISVGFPPSLQLPRLRSYRRFTWRPAGLRRRRDLMLRTCDSLLSAPGDCKRCGCPGGSADTAAIVEAGPGSHHQPLPARAWTWMARRASLQSEPAFALLEWPMVRAFCQAQSRSPFLLLLSLFLSYTVHNRRLLSSRLFHILFFTIFGLPAAVRTANPTEIARFSPSRSPFASSCRRFRPFDERKRRSPGPCCIGRHSEALRIRVGVVRPAKVDCERRLLLEIRV